MNIRFKIKETEYRIKSGALDLHLERVSTVKEGENAGKETFQHIGYHKNVFECLKTIPDEDLLQSECKTIVEVGKRYKEVLNELEEIQRGLLFKDTM